MSEAKGIADRRLWQVATVGEVEADRFDGEVVRILGARIEL
jgi:hypothetical protein